MGEFFPPPGRAPFLLVLVLGLLAGCGQDDAPDDETRPARGSEIARIVPAQEALAGAHVPTLDPVTMNDAEIRQAIGAGPRYAFRYTSTGKPVLTVSMRPDGATGDGMVKLNGSLIVLEPTSVDGDLGRVGRSFLLVADPIRITVTPERGEPAEDHDGVRRQEADMIFEVGQDLRVGYRGYLDCAAGLPLEAPPQ